MESRGRSTFLSLLAAAVAGLALTTVWQLKAPIDVSPIAPATGQAAQSVESSPVSAASAQSVALDELTETVTRPLFSPTRQQPTRAVTEETSAPAATPRANDADRLRLVGTMRKDGTAKRALIRAADEAASWVEIGGEIDGWRVETIGDSSVIVARADDRVELSLYAPRSADDQTDGASEPRAR